MKMSSLYALLATASLLAAPAFAADDAKTFAAGVAVVDVQGLMKDSTAAKSVRSQLETKHKSLYADISKKEEGLKKEEQELVKQRSVLSKEAFEEKARAFGAKQTDLQKEVQSKKAILDNGYVTASGDIQKAAVEIIDEIAKEKGFVIAIPGSQILYASKTIDITDEVLTKLNKKLPKLDVKFEAPKESAKEEKK